MDVLGGSSPSLATNSLEYNMKALISVILAAACFGSAITAMALSSRLSDAQNAVAKAKTEKLLTLDKLSQANRTIRLLEEEKEILIDRIPPNANECWARYRRQEAGKPLASR